MKWEILKGSEKDFEGAPEWATISYKYGCSDLIRFCNGWNHGCKFSGMREEMTRHYGITDLSKYEVIAERLPIAEPVVNKQLTTEWSGEGLPPVGVECEMLWNKEWVKCVIKAYGDEQFIFKADGHREWEGHIANFSFRPIRSPEDAARREVIDSLVEEFINHYGNPKGAEGYLGIANKLYDAGYRKVE